MKLVWLALLPVCGAPAQTDPRLAALHQTLESLHSQTGVSAVNPGGGPKLTLAKHQLRDWIDSQLGSIKEEGEEKASERMNKALDAIGFAPSKDGQNLLGSLGGISLKWEPGEILLVTTGVGIVCQVDESAYGYKRVDGQWRRIWESEQNDYGHYTPQTIDAVHVWQTYENGKPTGPAYILTLGNEWGCASAWHSVYYRIWRVDSSGSRLLLDESGDGYLRGQGYIEGSIVNSPMHFSGPVDVTVEFTQRSVDAGVHNREAIRHYLIDGDRVRRIAPVALSPRDFVDEWMTSPWSESQGWSSRSLSKRHQELHSDFVSGEFLGDTLHCKSPDLWQVGFTPDGAADNSPPKPSVYFLIRWMPPYRFTLRDIGNNPWPGCTQPDREADAWRTLFSTQEWRW